ncbi:LamB/YcsF family protein [Paenibacillus xylaniclasticus]|uniref:LamB/YcsF family protein n=1 Tax=Paenibacillus xylaniclasticus TaxID=588083 RepID=UPI000FD9D807|nr:MULTISPECIES: 5-oxoprolinase subunit PxpA [Paenibacillus]GFN33996.1 LamB/YcsF family protein [Paenibacillus curdlanolyticus]
MDKIIDLNCDMGESFGLYKYGMDEELMPLISSANVATGFHAGDPHVMRESVALAAHYGVRVGAHVGLPDRIGFGRREMNVKPQEIYDYVLYQLGALDAFLKPAGLTMSHIKPHGAWYMMAAEKQEVSEATVKAVLAYNPDLEVYTLPGSELYKSATEANLKVVSEYFADRPYYDNKVKMFGWTLEEIGEPSDIAKRALAIVEGSSIETVCVHSDTPGSAAKMQAVRDILVEAGWKIGVRK